MLARLLALTIAVVGAFYCPREGLEAFRRTCFSHRHPIDRMVTVGVAAALVAQAITGRGRCKVLRPHAQAPYFDSITLSPMQGMGRHGTSLGPVKQAYIRKVSSYDTSWALLTMLIVESPIARDTK